MGFILGLAQCGYPADGDVLAQVARYATKAATGDVSLLVFPENLMHPRRLTRGELCSLAEPIDGPFVEGMAKIAAVHGVSIAFTMNERNQTEAAPYNTAVVVDGSGTVLGSYRKCHLYDALGVRESDRLSAGNRLCHPIRLPFVAVCIGICYDLRFPESVRKAAESCDLLLFPAAWHDGPYKPQQWQALLTARAIENECYVAGVCHTGEGFVERSMVVDPMGEMVAAASPGEGLLVAEIDAQAVGKARRAMPVLSHRRPELYRG